MTRVLPVMTVGTNVLEMETASEKNARAILATLGRTAIHYALGTDRVVMTPVCAKTNGKVNSAKSPSVQTTVQEKACATAHSLRASVTLVGQGMTAANLIVQVNRIVTTEAHAQ